MVEAEVGVGEVGDLASARCALDEAFFYQVRLVHFLYRAGVFAERRGYGAQPHWASFEFCDDGAQQLVVYLDESVADDV